MSWFDVIFWTAYIAVGALTTRLLRGKESNPAAATALGKLERIGAWPIFAVALLGATFLEWRATVRARVFGRPPRWYDFLFFWV